MTISFRAALAALTFALSAVSGGAMAQCNDTGYTISHHGSGGFIRGSNGQLVPNKVVNVTNKVACFPVGQRIGYSLSSSSIIVSSHDDGPMSNDCLVEKTGNKAFRLTTVIAVRGNQFPDRTGCPKLPDAPEGDVCSAGVRDNISMSCQFVCIDAP